MFNNVGKTIKKVAKTLCWAGALFFCIVGFAIVNRGIKLGNSNIVITGMSIAVAGSLSCWIAALAFYGFGRLIENSDRIADAIESICEKNNTNER